MNQTKLTVTSAMSLLSPMFNPYDALIHDVGESRNPGVLSQLLIVLLIKGDFPAFTTG